MASIEGRLSGLRRKKSRSARRSASGVIAGEPSGLLTGMWSSVADRRSLTGSSPCSTCASDYRTLAYVEIERTCAAHETSSSSTASLNF